MAEEYLILLANNNTICTVSPPCKTSFMHITAVFKGSAVFCTTVDAASPHQAVLEKYAEEFMEVVYAKQSLFTLRRKKVITQEKQTDIDNARSDKAAREILYMHLMEYGSVDTLKVYCEEIIASGSGLPRMQELGKKMKAELEQGGG